MKWNIKSAITGTDFGTYEADNEEGAFEAMAQEIAKDEGVDVKHVISEIGRGQYSVTRVVPVSIPDCFIPYYEKIS